MRRPFRAQLQLDGHMLWFGYHNDSALINARKISTACLKNVILPKRYLHGTQVQVRTPVLKVEALPRADHPGRCGEEFVATDAVLREDMRTTVLRLDTYSHVIPSLQEEVARKIDDLMSWYTSSIPFS